MAGGGAAPAFDPLTLYSGGKKGFWIKPRDWTTLFQNSGGTGAVTTAGNAVGYFADQSGNGLHPIQATGTARGVAATQGGYQCVDFDGADDGAGLTFSSGTLAASMDCFITVYRDTTAQMIPIYGSGVQFAGVMQDGNSSAAQGNVGTPTYLVNGVAVPGGTATTRDQMNDAVPTGQWLVLSIRNLNLSALTTFNFANYASYAWNGKFAEIILCESVDATTRAKIETYLGAQVGLTL